jgi:hypothetical protein
MSRASKPVAMYSDAVLGGAAGCCVLEVWREAVGWGGRKYGREPDEFQSATADCVKANLGKLAISFTLTPTNHTNFSPT